MNLKKILCLLLTTAMVLSACGKTEEIEILPISETEPPDTEMVTVSEPTETFEEKVFSNCFGELDLDDPAQISETTQTQTEPTITQPPIKPVPVSDYTPLKSNDFTLNTADFSVELFKRSYNPVQNSMVSPASVLFAMSMTANGADGETLSQLEDVLGGGVKINSVNENLSHYINSLPSKKNAKLSIANSIWVKDDFKVNKNFLQTNKTYYNAETFTEPFNGKTLEKINSWVKKNTDNMIDKIIDDVSPNDVMYLINAIAFDAKWETPYEERDVRKRDFTNTNGIVQNVDFLHSTERRYVQDENATGFIKPYETGYSFVALLPNEGVTLDEYIKSLTGDKLMKTLNGVEYEEVVTAMPKFTNEYDVSMKEPLQSMGITLAFDEDNADFSKLGSAGNIDLYISDVLHKTFIEVDEQGTKAAAVTAVIVAGNSMPLAPSKSVILDRPFVYMIIDNETKLPLFIGTVVSIDN